MFWINESCMKLLFHNREERRKREKEKCSCEREASIDCLLIYIHPDQGANLHPGMCPDWELNQ